MQQNERPDCFGQLWSVGATECTGGYDVAYTGPNGSHIRPRCDHFEECGRAVRNRTVTSQVQAYGTRPPAPAYGQPQPQQYGRPGVPVPQPMIVRPNNQPTVAQQPGPPVSYPNFQYPQPPAGYLNAYLPGYPQQPIPQYPPHPYYGIQAPVVAPQLEMMPKNWFSTPSVLAVHEPRVDRPWASLGVEIFRGVCMITGLVSADFFSNIPLLKKPEE